jgi:hypothetical protein
MTIPNQSTSLVRSRRSLERSFYAIAAGCTLLLASWSMVCFAAGDQSGAARPAVAQHSEMATDISLLAASAAKGDPRSQDALGVLYAAGERVPQDRTAAFQWFQRAALAGLASAEFHLGDAYAHGDGVFEDAARAFEWYLKAALQGHAQAALAVAEAYLSGAGVARSDERAFPWLQQAAAQGLARAQYLFGMKHPSGPLSEDIAFAASWLRKAAEQNYAPAQYALAALYETNTNDDSLVLADPTRTFTRDVVEADRWFTICWKQSSGDVASRCGEALTAIERQMTGDQIFDAQSRATEWMRSHF